MSPEDAEIAILATSLYIFTHYLCEKVDFFP